MEASRVVRDVWSVVGMDGWVVPGTAESPGPTRTRDAVF